MYGYAHITDVANQIKECIGLVQNQQNLSLRVVQDVNADLSVFCYVTSLSNPERRSLA
jgi:hypothetical protein